MGMTNALNLLCGLALFLYGMHVMGEGLTRASGGRLEGILESLTKSKIKAVLLGAAALGGSVGALFGMWLFHHKTRKAKFFITIPLLLAAQCALLYWIYVH